ncbi:MAG: tetratricopeptide repeat protein [Bacteroidota bacterium]
MIVFRKYVIFIISAVILSITAFDGYAQRPKNKKGRTKESKLREAEFLFTEGEKYFILEDYSKALDRFQKSLEINPENATVYYKISQIHSEGGDLQKALQNINSALKINGDNKYFYVAAADIHTQLGDFEKASEIYEEMIAKLPNTDLYLFELAAIYLYQRRYDDALNTYAKIEEAYGLSEEVIFQKQKIHLQNNELENALAEGKKLIEAFPGEESYVIKQVEILISNDQYDDAERYLEEFLSISPNSAQSRLVLAELNRKQGKMDQVEKNLEVAFKNTELNVQNKVQLLAEYRQGLSVDELNGFGRNLGEILVQTHPEEADARSVYGDILQTIGDREGAVREYGKALEFDESNLAVWQNALQLHLELNQADSVIALSDKALELYPNQGVLFYFNGFANLQKKNYDEAIYSLEQGKLLSSSNLGLVSVFNGMLGDAYNSVKEYDKSDRAYDAALDFDANNYGILNNYSYYLALRKQKLDKAERMAAKVVKNNPDNITYIDTYSWVLYTREKYKEAKKIMERALDKEGVTAIHYEHYGDILYKLGQVDEAVKQWQIAKGLNPNAELIDKKIADRKLYE